MIIRHIIVIMIIRHVIVKGKYNFRPEVEAIHAKHMETLFTKEI